MGEETQSQESQSCTLAAHGPYRSIVRGKKGPLTEARNQKSVHCAIVRWSRSNCLLLSICYSCILVLSVFRDTDADACNVPIHDTKRCLADGPGYTCYCRTHHIHHGHRIASWRPHQMTASSRSANLYRDRVPQA